MAWPLSRNNKALITVLALAAIAAGAFAWAGEGDQRVAGATAEVAGTGGDVSAAGATVTVTGTANNIWAAGATVSVKATVTQNVYGAAADFTFEGTTGGNVNVVSGRALLRGKAGGDVRAAAAAIDADMSVGGNVRMFAGKIALGQATDIAGDLKAGGGDVGITGHVAGDVKVAAGRVLFDGRADKTVSIEADELIVGPNAVIGGDLVILGDTKSTVDPAAKVTGKTRNESSQSWFYGPRVDPRPGQLGFSLFIAGTAILTGIGLMLLGRANFDDAATLARRRPISRFLIGLVVFILLPIAAIILAVTVIGIPLSVGLLLFLPFLILIGHATASLGIADWVLNRAGTPRGVGRSILYLILGAIGIALLGLIPFVGPLIVFIALLAGAGAFLTALHGRLRRAPGGMAPTV
jgi:hypothetical protein